MVEIANMPVRGDGHFEADPRAISKAADERSDKQESTALEILKVIGPIFMERYTGAPLDSVKSGKEAGEALAAMAEITWRWATTDSWELPGDKPKVD